MNFNRILLLLIGLKSVHDNFPPNNVIFSPKPIQKSIFGTLELCVNNCHIYNISSVKTSHFLPINTIYSTLRQCKIGDVEQLKSERLTIERVRGLQTFTMYESICLSTNGRACAPLCRLFMLCFARCWLVTCVVRSCAPSRAPLLLPLPLRRGIYR